MDFRCPRVTAVYTPTQIGVSKYVSFFFAVLGIPLASSFLWRLCGSDGQMLSCTRCQKHFAYSSRDTPVDIDDRVYCTVACIQAAGVTRAVHLCKADNCHRAVVRTSNTSRFHCVYHDPTVLAGLSLSRVDRPLVTRACYAFHDMLSGLEVALARYPHCSVYVGAKTLLFSDIL